MASNVRPTAEGLEVMLKVTPKARQNKIVGFTSQGLKIQVTAAPEDGQANHAVIELLAKTCGVAKKAVTLLRGDKSKEKKVFICGEAETLLAALTKGLA